MKNLINIDTEIKEISKEIEHILGKNLKTKKSMGSRF